VQSGSEVGTDEEFYSLDFGLDDDRAESAFVIPFSR